MLSLLNNSILMDNTQKLKLFNLIIDIFTNLSNKILKI
jgi:hypothetical protein